ncbi:imidazole glycerol phosphate synthase cyclase subunit [Rhodoferax sp. BAB1]|uniref:imidazole glycerol phosphate synthase cyclase subunit n=1 Tax=Rhodoferax sp. BAB1 TaxID=2741720 RepID=UPI0015757ACF|nr:imidazole glycerol phosphate synthase cyclase subunit [Rhodoferax sp. BAB1]QKO22979.1 imidazole glycerol phosphate synthase subunit HisF [Rhodoferax sp. BAB1]
MLKKRIIFTLLVEDGFFVLSRNFGLQKAGDLGWLKDFYDFDSIAFSIDELIVLDVSRNERDHARFASLLQDISRSCFMPIAAGGGIRCVDDVELLLRSGADKVVVNTSLFKDEGLVRELVRRFGAQCIIASIDFMTESSGRTSVYIENGKELTDLSVPQAIEHVQKLGVGEIYLTSMTQDGTGRGLDSKVIAEAGAIARCPLIASGGAGTFAHIAQALELPAVSAVSTANLFNFMGDNLTEARNYVEQSGTHLAKWSRFKLLAGPT